MKFNTTNNFRPKLKKSDEIGLKIPRKSKYFEEITKNIAFRRLVLSDKLENSPLSIKIQFGPQIFFALKW